MKIEIVGRNLPIDDALRAFIEQKAKKLERLLDAEAEVRFTLVHEKHLQLAEIHASHRSGIVQASEETEGTLREAVPRLIEKAAEQLRRARDRRVKKGRRNGRTGGRWPVEVLDSASMADGKPPRVIETSEVAIKPMSVEEAVLALEDSAHGFVVFHDSARDRLSVLYRRKDKNYGLVAPEL
jgi:putative sigma-54 modulation protein